MWVGTRHEGYHGPESVADAARREPLKSGYVSRTWADWATRGFLRTGLSLQVLALLALILSHYAFEGVGLYSYELADTQPSMRTSWTYRWTCLAAHFAYFCGALFVMCFVSSLCDDAAWARGYRSGSKLLMTATFFEVFACVLQVSVGVNFAQYYSESFWTHFRHGSLDWIFVWAACLARSLSCALFGAGFFLIEAYHDEGTNDWHGMLNLILFGLTALVELLPVAFVTSTAPAVIFTLIAKISATLWSFAFEEEAFRTQPLFHESELCNDLEKEVENFAKRAPII